ncbi:response regulator [Caulobacter sp.]|uniref:response regulator transcription factor n=1 Tax=Caulobacter sp. TaxID=78 RepID=UPI001B1F7B84|nr:response regulator [Caulobacter sp.]MBO9547237.1 response regulator [Caulobacter sp.]
MPNRILIVDDDPMIRHFVDLVLTQQGFKVVTAASSDTAMQLLGREGFALVLLDINMPGMNGLDVLRLMRARPGRPKILMITAHRDPATIMQALEQGADGYLAKPFKPQDLLKRIETVLKGPVPPKTSEAKASDELILD